MYPQNAFLFKTVIYNSEIYISSQSPLLPDILIIPPPILQDHMSSLPLLWRITEGKERCNALFCAACECCRGKTSKANKQNNEKAGLMTIVVGHFLTVLQPDLKIKSEKDYYCLSYLLQYMKRGHIKVLL